jgi:hypothetical protein
MAIVHLCDVCGKQAKHGEVVQCHGCGKDLCPKCATEHRARVAAPDGGDRLGVALPVCKDCRAARVAAEDWAASDAGQRHLAKLGKGV